MRCLGLSWVVASVLVGPQFIGSAATSAAAEDPRRHHEVEGGFSYLVPDGWSTAYGAGSKLRFLRGPDRPGSIPSYVSFTPTAEAIGAVAFVEQFLDDQARSRPQAKLLAREPFGLQGETVVRLKYHVAPAPGETEVVQSIYLVCRPKLQIVAAATTPLQHPADGAIFDAVMRSFRIESDAAPQPPRPKETGPFDPAVDLSGRYHDLAGGFSYAVPEGWGPKYLVSALHVLSSKAHDSPDDSRFVSFNRFAHPELPATAVRRLAYGFTAPDSGNKLIESTSFPTLDGLSVTRLVCKGIRPAKSGGEAVRRRIGLICTLGLQYVAVLETPAGEGNALDAMFDDMLKSFRIEDQEFARRMEAEPERCFEPSAGVSYIPPEGWKLLGSRSGNYRNAVAPPDAGGNFTAAVGVERHDSPGTLDQLADELVAEETAKAQSLRVIGRKPWKVGDRFEGLQLTMEGKIDEATPPIRMTALLVKTERAKCSVALMYPAEQVAVNEPVFASVVESLRIEPLPGGAGEPFDPAAAAAVNEQMRPLPLPVDPAAWINSLPLTNESLAGKAVFYWFFDEQCPRCYEKWPELIDVAKSFEGQGAVFIAVNSGTERNDLDYYVKQVKLTWPVIVDTDRKLEAAADIGQISLKNIWQAKLMLPDGTTVHGDYNDVGGSLRAALGISADTAIASPSTVPTSPAPVVVDLPQDPPEPTKSLLLPTDADSWINSRPLSNERLAGKAVFLWFFEENCPGCRRRWPELFDLAKRFERQPVVFMAVNSGTPRAELEDYVKSVKLNWPLIVDIDRKFEAAAGVTPISLQNIWQVRLILPNGGLINGDWDDVVGSVERALPKATWRIDPAGIPEPLQLVRRQLELGEYAAAAGALQQSAEVPEHAAAVAKLRAAATDEMQNRLTDAKQLRDDGQSWAAHKTYASIATEFRDYDPPAEVAMAMKELEADPAVAVELIASKQWDAMKRAYRNAALTKSILDNLNRFVAKFPGTEAAVEAQKILDRAAAAKADD